MTTERRMQRRNVLLSIIARGAISKQELVKVLGCNFNADAWLADNRDLPFFETKDGRIKVMPAGDRRRGDPLIREIDTNGMGGIHAVRG
jgi:hypothetical protein